MPSVERALSRRRSPRLACAQVNVVGNSLINNMCSGTDGYTYGGGEPWTSAAQPFSFINVTGLNFQGNTMTINSGCAASQVRQKRVRV